MSLRLNGREAEVVRAAAGGDSRAWESLVDAHVGLIWAIARNHGLGHSDAGDVSQTTWLRLVENIDRIDDPSRIGPWLATTARRECLRILARSSKQVLVAESETLVDRRAEQSPGLDAAMLRDEREHDVRHAMLELTPRCQQLMQLLMLDPAPSYEEISAAMDMPVGSIGPTRGRCLRRLQGILAREGIEQRPRGVFDGEHP